MTNLRFVSDFVPLAGIAPAFLAAILVYRAPSASQGLLARSIAILAIVAVIPALGLNCVAFVFPLGW